MNLKLMKLFHKILTKLTSFMNKFQTNNKR